MTTKNKQPKHYNLRRTRNDMQLDCQRRKRQEEREYLIKIEATKIIIGNLECLMQLSQLSISQKSEIKQFIEVLKPHAALISKQIISQSWDDFETIIEQTPLTILENACNYLFITYTYSEFISDDIKNQAKPHLHKIKQQSENIINYFSMLEREY